MTVADEESDVFDGVETGLRRLLDFVAEEGERGAFVASGLERIEAAARRANDAFDAAAPWNTVPALRDGLEQVRALRAEVRGSAMSESARYELEHRLAPKEQAFENALALAHGVALDAIADRGEVTRGSELGVSVRVANRSPEPVNVQSVEIRTPSGWTVTRVERNDDGDVVFPELPASLSDNEVVTAPHTVRVSEAAAYDRPYWSRPDTGVDRFELSEPEHFGLPWSPPALTARVRYRSGDVEASLERTVPVPLRRPLGRHGEAEAGLRPPPRLGAHRPRRRRLPHGGRRYDASDLHHDDLPGADGRGGGSRARASGKAGARCRRKRRFPSSARAKPWRRGSR